jgi:hypothetical protein
LTPITPISADNPVAAISTQPHTTDASPPSSAPAWFRIVSIAALLWFLMDTFAFFMRLFMTEDAINRMPEDQQFLYRNIPLWVNVAFAGEVFAGVFGSIALLFRKRWALPLFVISILGTLAQTSNIWFLTDAISAMGAPAIVMPLVAITICTTMIVFSKYAISKQWLK